MTTDVQPLTVMELILLFLFLRDVVSLVARVATNYQSLLYQIHPRIETVPVINEGSNTFDECPPSQGNIGTNFSDCTAGQVLISCTLIVGFPLPNISWFYMDTELIMFCNSSEIIITVDDDTI